MKPITADVAERFLQYRKLNHGWSHLGPFMRSRLRTDAHIDRCYEQSVLHNDRHAVELIGVLRSLGPTQRARLTHIVQTLRPSHRTRTISRRLISDISLAVSDLACLKLIYLVKNEPQSRSLRALPNAQVTLVHLFLTRLVITISRILDPSISGARETASLEALCVSLRKDGFRTLATQISSALGRRPRRTKKRRRSTPASGIRKHAAGIVILRNRHFGHSDLRSQLHKKKLPSVDIAALDATIAAIAEQLNLYDLWMNTTSVKYQFMLDADRPMRDLLHGLRDPTT